MITSKDNPRLKLVRALQRKKEREETGLFACEGEDLCDAALAAGIEPVDLLIAGENVEPELLAGVSTLPHPAACDRRLPPRRPTGRHARDVPRPLAALRPRQRRHADPLGRRVRRRRLALAEGAPTRSRRRRCGRVPARSSACRSCPGTSVRAARSRSTRAAPCRSTEVDLDTAGDDRARCRAGGASRRAPGGVRHGRVDPDAG